MTQLRVRKNVTQMDVKMTDRKRIVLETDILEEMDKKLESGEWIRLPIAPGFIISNPK